MRAAATETIAVLVALARYRAGILPSVRRQLGRWRALAAEIPDPTLREQALAALDEKGLNVEATAVFATLAPRRRRATALRALVALQVAVDYLDTLGEQECEEPLRNGLALHEALEAAVTPGTAVADWYRFHPQREDGGYLAQLVASCQESLRALPARAAIAPLVERAARRCGEGQSQTHAAAVTGSSAALEAWASGLEAPSVYSWWEVAAGASSSVAIHALVAAAAEPRTSVAEAELIGAAYFPPIAALTVLLDDLIDRDADIVADAHSYVAYYADGHEAASRLDLLAQLGRAAISPLRHHHRHAAILSGIVGFYLSGPRAQAPMARPSHDRLLRSSGPAVRPIVAFMRRRRR